VEIEKRIEELGLTLPAPMKTPPGVTLSFPWVRVHGDRAYVSGHGPLLADGSLAGPFGKVTDWPAHLEHLTHFWWVTLGGERYLDYRYAVPAKHADVGFTPTLLGDWLALFRQTVRSHLPGDLAEPWIERAERIGESLRLMYELGHFNNSPSKSSETVPSA